MAAVAAEYEGRVNFVGIASNGQVADMESFVADYGVELLDHVADPSGEIRAGFGVTYQPAYAFIDDSGAIQTLVASLGDDELRSVADQLLAA